MNPIQGGGVGNLSFFSCWTLSEILAGLIYRRTVDLKVEALKTGHTGDLANAVIVPDNEMKYFVQNAVAASTFLDTAYFNEFAAGTSGQPQQQRRTA
jgi:hypothetical protein